MNTLESLLIALQQRDPRAIARAISLVEEQDEWTETILSALDETQIENGFVAGITGPPGAGKSTLTNSLVKHYRASGQRIGIVAVDPSSPISGGALLGDRIRMMQHATDNDVVIRSMASRGRLGGLCAAAGAAVRIMAGTGCSPVIIETVGVGQSEMDIVRLADITVLVLAPGLGDDVQAMKAGLLEVVDLIVVNKADCKGADALAMDMEAMARDRMGVKKAPPVCLTVASEGKGIEQLSNHLAQIDADHRASGERRQRRNRAYELEVLDWCVELQKPVFKDYIKKAGFRGKGDPRLLAKKILEAFQR
jgi:LAO/AO transport system kinase